MKNKLKICLIVIFVILILLTVKFYTLSQNEAKKKGNEDEVPVEIQLDYPSVLPNWKNGEYHDYYRTTKMLNDLNKNYPNLVDIFSIGQSVKNRDIWCIRITNEQNRTRKYSCLIDGCIHGNEWESGEACLYLAEYLLINYGYNNTVRNVLNTSEIYIIPILNPDGRENDDRFNENGIDLNRNFDVHFGRILGRSIPLGKILGFIKIRWFGIPRTGFFWTNSGRRPFSEPESQALKDFMNKINNGYFSFYLSCHTATHCIASPSIGVKRSEYEISPNELAVYDNAKNWISKNTEYRASKSKGGYGNGNSMAWCYKEFQIPSFTFELLTPDYDPWFSSGKHDHLIHWMKTGLPVFLYMLVNIENLNDWEIPDIHPPLPKGVPPSPLN